MKKFLSFLFVLLILNLCLPLNVFALDAYSNTRTEHLKLSKKLAKKASINVVNVSDNNIKILPYNTLEVSFAKDFTSKTASVGDYVPFLFADGLYTEEGTTIFEPGTKLVAQISNIVAPKVLNKAAKVYMDFIYIEKPNGEKIAVQANLFNKKDYLSRGKLNALGKGLGSTLAGMGVGIGAGCGIGAAASAVVVGGFAIGLPVGFAIGAGVGLVAPGLQYRAKAGDKIYIQLANELNIAR